MPEPEKFTTFTRSLYFSESFFAIVARSILMTSDGQDPTRNNRLMSGRLDSSSPTVRSSSTWASAIPAKSVSSRIAVAKRGSAKIITPAALCNKCAQVRDPTTRKKASCILRCNQMIEVRPQNTSCWPRSLRTGVDAHPIWLKSLGILRLRRGMKPRRTKL